jgi:hypothetical protein
MKRNYIEFAKIKELILPRKSPRGTLCAACRRIDFDNIFSQIDADYVANETPIWSPRMHFAPNCALCSMTRSLLRFDLNDGCGWHFRASLSIKEVGYYLEGANITMTGRTVFLVVVRGTSTLGVYDLDDDNFTSRGLICVQDSRTPENGKRTVPLTGSNEINSNELNQHDADFGLMREWLEPKCQSHVPITSITSNFHCRVIDCEDLVVVQHDPSVKYVALSYVWGKPKLAWLGNRSKTIINAPQTVKDAMYATKRLGLRYLWVDRYCIPEEGNERHVQIANMHLIYGAAYATIVAANPGPKDSARSGLYGVSKPRNLQHKFNHDGRLFVSTPVDLAYPLSKSVWATRGWTYQEAALSSRCLLFTPDQVYYADSSGYQVESLRHSLLPSPKGSHQTLGPPPISLFSHDYDFNPWGLGETASYDFHLVEYAKRSMTFPSDALNAFRGILAKATGASVWGIPFMPSQSSSATKSLGSDLYFAQYLSWTGVANCEERQKNLTHFPSWSWASVSEIRSAGASDGFNPVDNQHHARFGVERADGSIVALRDVIFDRAKSHQIIPEETFFLHITSWVFQATVELYEQSQTYHVTALRSSGDQYLEEIQEHPWHTHFDVRGSGLVRFKVKPHVVVTAVFIGLSRFNSVHYLLLEPGAEFYRRVGLLKIPSWYDPAPVHLIKEATNFPPVAIRLR